MSFFIGVNCFLGRFGSCIKETWDAHIRFFDDRIVNTSWQGETTFSYRQVERLGETEGYFLLYIRPG